MHITIRPCTIKDLNELLSIGKETFFETFKDENTEQNMDDYLTTAFTVEKLTAELNNPNSQFYFATVNGELAGYLKVNVGIAQTENMDDDSLEVERIYIKKAFQNHGLGKHLIDKAIEIATEQKKNFIWLGVWEKNTKAILFYEKAGFITSGTHSFYMGDEEQTDIIMKKQL